MSQKYLKSIKHITNLITDCAELKPYRVKNSFRNTWKLLSLWHAKCTNTGVVKVFLWLSVHRHVEMKMRTIKFLFHPIIRVMNRICTTHTCLTMFTLCPWKLAQYKRNSAPLTRISPFFIHRNKQASRQPAEWRGERLAFNSPKNPDERDLCCAWNFHFFDFRNP